MISVLASAMSVQDPHEVPADAQDSARAKHAQWRHLRSDFLTLLKLWQQWRDWNETAKNRQLRKLCRDHYVSFLRKIGRAHVCTPVTNAPLVCRLLLDKQKHSNSLI